MDSLGAPPSPRAGRLAFWAGLAAVLGYWFWIHPQGFSSLGYSEDICFGDLMRSLMAGILDKKGGPFFHTEKFQAPFGASVPFMSWGMERDWLGAYFWKLDPAFPFQWVYYGVSLLVSYSGVGWILGRMGVARRERWALAAIFVAFNVPRHFKTWHHYEHLAQHWVYLGVFLDAWIWSRFVRERRWSPRLEVWRLFVLLGTFGTAGYYWGPMILEWVLVRAFMAARWRRPGGSAALKIEPLDRRVLLPVGFGLVLLVLDLRWYLPLLSEARQWGQIDQRIGFFAHFGQLVRPLWLQPFLPSTVSPIDRPETVVTVGWVYWVPWMLGLRAGGVRVVAPFVALLVIALLYMNFGDNLIHWPVQHLVPFMKFFRVASRWGLLLPPILGAMVAILWPQIRAWGLARRRSFGILAGVLALIEFSALATPVNMMPPMPRSARAMLERVRDLPGDTVLDLPFCVTGGNQGCAPEQCSFFPAATTAACLQAMHGKKVYGLYQSRMSEAQCDVFRKAPYESWFNAWRENRCFTGPEWDQFCAYLPTQAGVSAVLVYPEIWSAAAAPACAFEFERRLGRPKGVAGIQLRPTRGGAGEGSTRVMWYGNRCL